MNYAPLTDSEMTMISIISERIAALSIYLKRESFPMK